MRLAVVLSMFMVCGCDHPRHAAEAPVARSHMRLQLRCTPHLSLLQCQALAADELTMASESSRDVTDIVRWTSSDTRAGVLQGGVIRIDRGATATVTAFWDEMPGTPPSSVIVVADANTGEARQAYLLEGEVRRFPSAEGIAGAQVSLIDERGLEQIVTTASHGDTPGQFQFVPVSSGTYRLRASRQGYRSTQVTIAVPDDVPRTITLLQEPSAPGGRAPSALTH